jgi:hypothetical protein
MVDIPSLLPRLLLKNACVFWLSPEYSAMFLKVRSEGGGGIYRGARANRRRSGRSGRSQSKSAAAGKGAGKGTCGGGAG